MRTILALALLAAASSAAQAAWTGSAATCVPDGSTNDDVRYAGSGIVYNESTTTHARVVCALPHGPDCPAEHVYRLDAEMAVYNPTSQDIQCTAIIADRKIPSIRATDWDVRSHGTAIQTLHFSLSTSATKTYNVLYCMLPYRESTSTPVPMLIKWNTSETCEAP